jgi:uncharacterized protein (TIGR03437 family)
MKQASLCGLPLCLLIGGSLLAQTTLDNVSVLIDGKKAAIAYVSPTQLNVQAPLDTATGMVPVQTRITRLKMYRACRPRFSMSV